MYKAAILTINDRCSKALMKDISGPAIKDMIRDIAKVEKIEIIPNDYDIIKLKLIHFADDLKVDFVFTTGGTGPGPRDITPEATLSVLEKVIPGIPELMRAETRHLANTNTAILSRARAGIRRKTLIINLPGSVKGVMENLTVILGILKHAKEMIDGEGH
jgi:molybdenum cofactor synthesis domain-containing protein